MIRLLAFLGAIVAGFVAGALYESETGRWTRYSIGGNS
jgi:fructose-specific phosphotransferase system IIC component